MAAVNCNSVHLMNSNKEILESIEKNGFHEEWRSLLQNVYFKARGKKPQEWIDEFCQQHGLTFSVIERLDGKKKMQPVLRFTKAPS